MGRALSIIRLRMRVVSLVKLGKREMLQIDSIICRYRLLYLLVYSLLSITWLQRLKNWCLTSRLRQTPRSNRNITSKNFHRQRMYFSRIGWHQWTTIKFLQASNREVGPQSSKKTTLSLSQNQSQSLAVAHLVSALTLAPLDTSNLAATKEGQVVKIVATFRTTLPISTHLTSSTENK